MKELIEKYKELKDYEYFKDIMKYADENILTEEERELFNKFIEETL